MAEIVAILVRGERVGTVCVFAAQQVQECSHVLVVYKFARIVDAEKFAEIEGYILGQRRSSVDGLTEYPADAVHKEGKIGDSVQLRSKAF